MLINVIAINYFLFYSQAALNYKRKRNKRIIIQKIHVVDFYLVIL